MFHKIFYLVQNQNSSQANTVASPGKLPNPAARLDCLMRQYYPQYFTAVICLIFCAGNNFLNVNLQYLVKCSSNISLMSEIWLIINSIALTTMIKNCKPHDNFLKTHNEFVAYYLYVKNQKENRCQNVK